MTKIAICSQPTVGVQLGAGNTRYLILVDGIRTLMCFDNGVACPCNRKCYTHGPQKQQPLKMTKLQMWYESAGAPAMSHENWGYSNRGKSKYLVTINMFHYITHGAQICFPVIVLRKYNSANAYRFNKTLWTGEACIKRSLSHLQAWDNPHAMRERIKSSSASTFGLVSSGLLALAPVC